MRIATPARVTAIAVAAIATVASAATASAQDSTPYDTSPPDRVAPVGPSGPDLTPQNIRPVVGDTEIVVPIIILGPAPGDTDFELDAMLGVGPQAPAEGDHAILVADDGTCWDLDTFFPEQVPCP